MSPAEAPRVVVWRIGGATLALPLDDVVEVVGVDAGGVAIGRDGPVELVHLDGVPARDAPRAVVLRTGAGLRALPADAVRGVADAAETRMTAPPDWLSRVRPAHLSALLRLPDDSIATLLSAQALVVEA